MGALGDLFEYGKDKAGEASDALGLDGWDGDVATYVGETVAEGAYVWNAAKGIYEKADSAGAGRTQSGRTDPKWDAPRKAAKAKQAAAIALSAKVKSAYEWTRIAGMFLVIAPILGGLGLLGASLARKGN